MSRFQIHGRIPIMGWRKDRQPSIGSGVVVGRCCRCDKFVHEGRGIGNFDVRHGVGIHDRGIEEMQQGLGRIGMSDPQQGLSLLQFGNHVIRPQGLETIQDMTKGFRSWHLQQWRSMSSSRIRRSRRRKGGFGYHGPSVLVVVVQRSGCWRWWLIHQRATLTLDQVSSPILQGRVGHGWRWYVSPRIPPLVQLLGLVGALGPLFGLTHQGPVMTFIQPPGTGNGNRGTVLVVVVGSCIIVIRIRIHTHSVVIVVVVVVFGSSLSGNGCQQLEFVQHECQGFLGSIQQGHIGMINGNLVVVVVVVVAVVVWWLGVKILAQGMTGRHGLGPSQFGQFHIGPSRKSSVLWQGVVVVVVGMGGG